MGAVIDADSAQTGTGLILGDAEFDMEKKSHQHPQTTRVANRDSLQARQHYLAYSWIAANLFRVCHLNQICLSFDRLGGLSLSWSWTQEAYLSEERRI